MKDGEFQSLLNAEAPLTLAPAYKAQSWGLFIVSALLAIIVSTGPLDRAEGIHTGYYYGIPAIISNLVLILFLVTMAVFSGFTVILGKQRLVLNQELFTYYPYYGEQTYQWINTSPFYVPDSSPIRNGYISFSYNGEDKKLFNRYNCSNDEFAKIMSHWRKRALNNKNIL